MLNQASRNRFAIGCCVLCVAWMPACGDSSGPEPGSRSSLPAPEPGDTLSLAPGESVTVGSAGIRVQFLAVEQDSRCPLRAQCVWAGDGVVSLRIEVGEDSPVGATLHTNQAEGPSAIRAGAYEVRLVELQPYPEIPGGIAEDDYRALLTLDPGSDTTQ